MSDVPVEFDEGSGIWSLDLPAGPALGAAAVLFDEVVVEADLADPSLTTSLHVPDNATGRAAMYAVLGFGIGTDRLLEDRASATIDLPPASPAALALNRWAIADRHVHQYRDGARPLRLAGWLVDAIDEGAQVERTLHRDGELVVQYLPRLVDAIAELARQEAPPNDGNISRRLRITAGRATSVELRDVLERFASWLDASLVANDTWDPRVRLGGSLTVETARAEVIDAGAGNHTIVAVRVASNGDPLVVRAMRASDGVLVALGRLDDDGVESRGLLLVPPKTPVIFEVTDRPNDPLPPAARSTDLANGTDAASLATSAAANQRLGWATHEHWLDVAEAWRMLDDPDRAWLACEYALQVAPAPVRGVRGSQGPGAPRYLRRLVEGRLYRRPPPDGPADTAYYEAEELVVRLARELDPEWAEDRPPSAQVKTLPFVGDLVDALWWPENQGKGREAPDS